MRRDEIDSDAYIDAYVEADEDVQRETYPPRQFEARVVALFCAVVSDLARRGELSQSLANDLVEDRKTFADEDVLEPEETADERRLLLEAQRANRRYLIEAGELDFEPGRVTFRALWKSGRFALAWNAIAEALAPPEFKFSNRANTIS